MRKLREDVAKWIGFAGMVSFFAFIPFAALSQESKTSKPRTALLADGMPVHLILMDDLQGKKLRAKQTVHFEVRADLVVGSQIVVKTGAEAFGPVESVSKSGLLGKSGRLVLQFDYVKTVSGGKLALRGGARLGEERVGHSAYQR